MHQKIVCVQADPNPQTLIRWPLSTTTPPTNFSWFILGPWFSHLRPNFCTETTYVVQMISKKVSEVIWFHWNCRKFESCQKIGIVLWNLTISVINKIFLPPCRFYHHKWCKRQKIKSFSEKVTICRTRSYWPQNVVVSMKFSKMTNKMDAPQKRFQGQNRTLSFWYAFCKKYLIDARYSMTSLISKTLVLGTLS